MHRIETTGFKSGFHIVRRICGNFSSLVTHGNRDGEKCMWCEGINFSDSQSAVGLLTSGWTPTSYKNTTDDVKEKTERLRQRGTGLEICE